MGDEQLLDVELDRRTELRPMTEYAPARLSLSDMGPKNQRDTETIESDVRDCGTASPPGTCSCTNSRSEGRLTRPIGYATLLGSLLPSFPLTLKGIVQALLRRNLPLRRSADLPSKERASITVPYTMTANPKSLRSLVPGRRKAIEVCSLGLPR